jgi:ABC-type nitrate/sulfonate/bicarbonate transport system substrate-binding protein
MKHEALKSLSRRRLLGLMAIGGGALVLAACDSDSDETIAPAAAAPAAAPAAKAEPAVDRGPEPDMPEIPSVDLKWGNGPFLDHSESVIGVENGWFRDVGITLVPEPYGIVVPSSDRAAILGAGTASVISAGAYAALPINASLPGVVAFTLKDTFLGFALIAQPDADVTTYDEFIEAGDSVEDAVRKAAQQIEGMRWAYPGNAFTKQFIDMVLSRAGLTEDDITLTPTDDPKTVNLMLSGQSDFSTTGAPSRIELQNKGFKVVLPFDPLFGLAEPSPDSIELRAVLHAGWTTTLEFAEGDWDTILRMFSVQYRITREIRQNPEDALAIHIPFLNSIAGRAITVEDGLVIYNEIDPFIMFEELDPYMNDPSSPLYYGNTIGSKLKGYIESELFAEGDIEPEDVTLVPRIYAEMLDLKDQAEASMADAVIAINDARAAGGDITRAQEVLATARVHHGNYNYLDSSRLAAAAVEFGEHAG